MILTKVSVDYGFLVGDGDAESRTTLLVKASRSKAVVARCVAGNKSKGRDDPTAVG